MNRRDISRLPLAMAAVAAMASSALLSACSREPEKPVEPPIDRSQALAVLAAEGKGFTVGTLMAANTVYVLFDPQCPHCAALWEASLPLMRQTKFVWLPVALLNAKSLPQGAAIMAAANPTEAMTAHEKSLLAGQGGTSASASVPDELRTAIERNTALLNRLGAESVPYVVGRHATSGATVAQAGAMPTAALANLLGLVPN